MEPNAPPNVLHRLTMRGRAVRNPGDLMAASSADLHEREDKLRPETIDRHRAVVSIMEELEAVDWYDQRIDAADDAELRTLLAHNRDEEKEHAAMMLEWLRRHDAKLNEHLRTYLFTDKPLLEIEAADEHGDPAASAQARDGSLGIRSLRPNGNVP